jgi:hypothetical protein
MVTSIRLALALRQQSEEARPGPVRSSDLLGDLGQGGITAAAVFETILGDGNGMGPATPFADKTRPWLEGEAWCCADPARRTQGLGQRLQLAKCHFAQPTVRDLLPPVGYAEDQQVAADPGRVIVVETLPFATQLVQACDRLNELRRLRGWRPWIDGPPGHDQAARGFALSPLGLGFGLAATIR